MLDKRSAQAAIDAISGPYAVQVLHELSAGPYTHNALARATELDRATLTRRLRRLENKGLVRREVTHRPLRVHYDLTARGHALLKVLHDLADCWNHHPSKG